MQVYFNPQSSGNKSGTLSFVSNVSDAPNIALSGVAVPSDRSLLVPVDLIEETLVVGDSTERVFVLKNTGETEVNYNVSTAVFRLPKSGSVVNNMIQSTDAKNLNAAISTPIGSTQETANPELNVLALPQDPSAVMYGGYNDMNTGTYHPSFFNIEDINDPTFIENLDQLSGFSNAGEFIKLDGAPYLVEITFNGELV